MEKHSFGRHSETHDYGCTPFVCNVCNAAEQNENFRTVLWTGQNLQLTLMCIPIGGEIGAEMHNDVDQFIRIESGRAKIYLGKSRYDLHEQACVDSDFSLLVPAGTWHNVINAGNRPLKLSSLYAPPQHPAGTIQRSKTDAEH